ncbi:hypothetical protein [Evansella clarkii]|uniref:hypothetical protein n=1 Tax=Evansella clarkii TaxID=79879 RepID=UPI000B4538F5|nr:hypothetical protein [Evansella clarkii]
MKIENIILYIMSVVSIFAVMLDSLALYIFWVVLIIVGSLFMAFKDKGTKKGYLWWLLAIFGLVLTYYIIRS